MNVTTSQDRAILGEHDAAEADRLARLEWEMLPNEFRGMRRQRPARRPHHVVELVTPAVWAAFGIDWTEDWR